MSNSLLNPAETEFMSYFVTAHDGVSAILWNLLVRFIPAWQYLRKSETKGLFNVYLSTVTTVNYSKLTLSCDFALSLIDFSPFFPLNRERKCIDARYTQVSEC